MDVSKYSVFPNDITPFVGSAGDPLSIGYIYVIGFAEAEVVKIGSATFPSHRLTELQCGNPFELKLQAVVSIYSGEPVLIERAAHRLAAPARIRGEWFELSVDEAVGAIIKAARNKKARFGAFSDAYAAASKPDATADEERRRRLRVRLGIEDA